MLFFSTFFLLVAAVVAIPAPEIVRNSERLARRLPPLPPKFGRTLPGYSRAAENPTPAYAAKRSSTSATPISYEGRIEVRDGKHVVGYVGNSKKSFGGVNLGGGEDLYVNIKTTSSGSGPFDIVALHPKWNGEPYLGGQSSEHSPGPNDKITFTHVEQTAPNSPPVHVHDVYEQSAIWSINPSTKELTAHWVDINGNKHPVDIVYENQENDIFFVGDIHAYSNENHDSASSVKFYLAPDHS